METVPVAKNELVFAVIEKKLRETQLSDLRQGDPSTFWKFV